VEIAKQSLFSEVIKTLKRDNAFEVVMNRTLMRGGRKEGLCGKSEKKL